MPSFDLTSSFIIDYRLKLVAIAENCLCSYSSFLSVSRIRGFGTVNLYF